MLQIIRMACVILILAVAVPAWADTPTISEAEYPGVTEMQKTLSMYYNSLLAIKQQQEFVDKGFGAGFKAGHAWMQGLMAARDIVDTANLPYQIKDGFTALISLGTDYMEMRRSPIRDVLDLSAREEQIWNDRVTVLKALSTKIE